MKNNQQAQRILAKFDALPTDHKQFVFNVMVAIVERDSSTLEALRIQNAENADFCAAIDDAAAYIGRKLSEVKS
ncbi:hypothetical protein [Thiothrix fructosivorans]|uniref:Uncharacterized protein n=1 Tax=Thiothrix fructosivorans TaxID=111770 RepID=A0A8B0SKU2_9GAMM|nr:hypothetical protein [Thiothrix fructosivorans]MBO0612967.1 hypothetical protein [Thiothrix fructosivorans]QTX11584.1 hypothetical protein J1836_004315 [Thiothrix fructosivorans]